MALGFEAASYAGANARVSGLRARLLDDETWTRLLDAGSLGDVFVVLRDTAYAEALPSGQGQGTSLEGVERQLMGQAAGNCRKCMTFLQGASRVLLKTWWGHFELENLKAVFRGVDQGLSPDQIRDFQIPLGSYSLLPWDLLLNERSIPGLVERLAGTHYINPVRNALHLYARYGSLFPLEVALDVRYYRDIAVAIAHLGMGDREAATRLLGTYLDILNILWAYRYRVYFGLSAEEIVNFTLWHTVHTDVVLIQAIAMGAEPEEIVPRIWGADQVDLTPLAEAQSDADKVPLLELVLLRFWRDLARGGSSGYPFGVGPILAYLILQELEIRDLVTILEAKSLGWDQEHIRAHLLWQ